MAELPLPTFKKTPRPSLSVDEILAKGREAAAATGQIITGDTPHPVEHPAPERAAPPSPLPTGPVEQERQEPVASPAANTGASSGRRPKRSKPTARIGDDKGRVVWQTQIRPDFLLQVRTLALHRNVSPYDVLDDALTAYLRDHAAK
ncbi:hypothetical protein [Microvirga tunisiensis]|uniref:Uncharacterized protein n=1 Tax=Microvirga tunisiensis TaxID=2108360 RepID=A0A5N7MV19_9HYPH|nr:hypothetical protein [Microvirga tunisiensis]MPR09744.1 hypothetical protein [Microvirga tunisiensis]MPR27906.1 hypothetical protein [Microvirga tunisiensis]